MKRREFLIGLGAVAVAGPALASNNKVLFDFGEPRVIKPDPATLYRWRVNGDIIRDTVEPCIQLNRLFNPGDTFTCEVIVANPHHLIGDVEFTIGSER